MRFADALPMTRPARFVMRLCVCVMVPASSSVSFVMAFEKKPPKRVSSSEV